MADPEFFAAPVARRRLQFSVRTLALLMLVAGVSFGGWRWATTEKRAIAEIERGGGRVTAGEDNFGSFRAVHVVGGDPFLAQLPNIADVRVVLVDDQGVTDAGLAPLARLEKLEDLWLHNCQIGNDGASHLAGLGTLITLGLDHTLVGDAGLAHLKGLSNLEELDLSGNSGVSDAGVVHLLGLQKLKVIHLDGSAVSDDGGQRLRDAIPGIQVER